ncbi:uncharacterized protein [Dermacentor andersoni]|uniref:uncharacterized protein n=1 Tax=Dermacentor andersoni TaxID=34620 RepID=UPI00241768FC|nr:clumping factor A-like [Dermacentor andersoni]
MCEPVSAVPASSNTTGSAAPRGSLWPLGDDKALPIGVGQDNDSSSSDFHDNRLAIPHVSPQGNDDHRTDGSWHESSPKESPNAINAPSVSIDVALDLHKPSLGTAGPEAPSRGVSATDAKDAPLLNSNTSSSTPSPTQLPNVDNASATASVSQSREEISARTLATISGDVFNGSLTGANANNGPKAANASTPLDEQTDDDDDDDDVPGDVGSERSDGDSAQNVTLGGRDDSESSKHEEPDDSRTTDGEQGSLNQGRDSTSKTLEDTLQSSASTISSQQAIEGHISSTRVDHPTSASNATGEGTADQHSTPH